MLTLRLIACLIAVTSVLPNACRGQQTQAGEPALPTHAEPPSANRTSPILHDDLSWLVGRWRCISRQYLTRQEDATAAAGSSLLEYFNVYFPFEDNRLSLALTDNPEDRPIAAEFLVRHVYEIGEFRELQGPMFEGGRVRISKDHMWYGSPLSPDFDFKYRKETRGTRLWLVLESRSMRFELIKLFAEVGDVRQSSCAAPIRHYTAEQIEDLRRRFEALKGEGAQPPSAWTGNKPETGNR